MTIPAGGSASAWDYYGVDANWYAGTSWTRPIFDNAYNNLAGNNIITLSVWGLNYYLTLDNIEIEHYFGSTGCMIGAGGVANILLENLYLHGWRTSNTTDNAQGGIIFTYSGDPQIITNVILQTSELTNAENQGIQMSGVAVRQIQTITGCRIHDVSSAVLFTAVCTHNDIYNVSYPAANMGYDQTYHMNGVYLAAGGLLVGGQLTAYCYDNKIHDVSAGANCIYPVPYGSPSNGYSENQYIFNNIVYGVQSAQLPIEVDPNTGTGANVFVFNNTIICYNNNAPGVHVVNRGSKYMLNNFVCQNNLLIGIGITPSDATSSDCTYISMSNNLTLTPAVASADGYLAANLWAPRAVNAGVVPSINTAVQGIFSVDYAGISRQQGTPWEIGAFQYVSSVAPTITSSTQVTPTAGSPFTYTITATNNPTSFSASPLPTGLTIDTSTGVISGTLTGIGQFSPITIGATNASGTGTAVLTMAPIAAQTSIGP